SPAASRYATRFRGVITPSRRTVFGHFPAVKLEMPKVVLLAEHSKEDAGTVQIALKKAGVANRVFIVGDGDEAIAYLKGEGQFANRETFPLPSVLILDLKMPRV